VKIDSLYREDQFYFGLPTILYKKNLQVCLKKKLVSQDFLGTCGLFDDRTIAIASGIGFSYNNYNENLFITTGTRNSLFFIDSKTVYNKNKFKQLLIDVPIEFRWRTST
jgi:hypothetical protein